MRRAIRFSEKSLAVLIKSLELYERYINDKIEQSFYDGISFEFQLMEEEHSETCRLIKFLKERI